MKKMIVSMKVLMKRLIPLKEAILESMRRWTLPVILSLAINFFLFGLFVPWINSAHAHSHNHFWRGFGAGILAGPLLWGPPPPSIYPWHHRSPYDYYDYRYDNWRWRQYSPQRWYEYEPIWIPRHWEWRWNPYYRHRQRIRIPGHWEY